MQYSADLQSVHGFRCYDNTHVCKLIALYIANAYSAEREMSARACTGFIAGFILQSKTYHSFAVLIYITSGQSNLTKNA